MQISPNTKLYIATPCFGSQLHAAYVHSLLRTSNTLTKLGLEHVPAFVPGDSLITRARNVLVAQFMAGTCTHFLFIDGDIQWDDQSVLRLLAASEAHEVCCGVYPKKCLPPEYPVNFMPGASDHLNQDEQTGYVEIKDAPTGFLMVRRSAFERMMAAYPERKCILRQDSPAAEAPFEFNLFDCFIDDGRYLSEDFGFSRLWQGIGGRVWMDPQINLTHFGQYAYKGEITSILIPKGARPGRAEDIEGWMTHEELEFLRGAALNVDSIAEIGCWKGRSTFALLSGCDGPVYAVDHWLGSEGERAGPHAKAVTGDIFSQFMTNVGHFPNLRVVKQPSAIAAAQTPEVDMVFIDAGHRYEDVVIDIRAWKSKAAKLMCGHDYNWPGVQRAVAVELGEVQKGPGSIWIKEMAA